MKIQNNNRMQNTVVRICTAVLFLTLIVSPNIFAQHQGMVMGGNQNIQMQSMQNQMKQMQNMMTQMNGLVSKSSMMVSMMKGSAQMQSMGNMETHSKMLPLMQNMESMAKGMDGTLNELNKMMGDQEMMKDDAMGTHVKDMMGQMKSMMEDYDGMLNSMRKAQEKGNK